MPYRFLDLTQVALRAEQKQKMISHELSNPRNISFSISHKSYFGTARRQILRSQCHLTAWYIAFSISPSHILGRTEGRKYCRWVSLNDGTSLYRLHSSRICGVQKAENRFSDLFNHLKHRFSDFTIVAYCEIQKSENEFQGFSTTWNFAIPTLPVSHFATFRRQIMSSQIHSNTWNITSSKSSKSLFGCQEVRKWVRMAYRHFEASLYRLQPSRNQADNKTENEIKNSLMSHIVWARE
jgi:hypothetical protein